MAESIKLTWSGRAHFIPRAKIMRARQTIESVYSLKELATDMQGGDPHLVRLSMAYGNLLRFAGASVEDEEIYDDMFGESSSLGATAAECLLNILIPESARAGGEEPQEPNPTSPSETSSKSQ